MGFFEDPSEFFPIFDDVSATVWRLFGIICDF